MSSILFHCTADEAAEQDEQKGKNNNQDKDPVWHSDTGVLLPPIGFFLFLFGNSGDEVIRILKISREKLSRLERLKS